MEHDRAETDIGIAADIEAAQLPQPSSQPAESAPLRQPKKRFVGRRAADAAKGDQASPSTTTSNGTEIQRKDAPCPTAWPPLTLRRGCLSPATQAS